MNQQETSTLKSEVQKTMEFFVNTDKQVFGSVQPETEAILKKQNMEHVLQPKDRAEEIFNSLVGQKATIVKYGEFGFMHSIKCTIQSVYRKDYAQYRNMLHVIYRPQRKRQDYVFRIYDYSRYIVYAGHVDVDTEMFRTTLPSDPGVTVQQSLLSFSDEYITIALNSTNQTPLLVVRNPENEKD